MAKKIGQKVKVFSYSSEYQAIIVGSDIRDNIPVYLVSSPERDLHGLCFYKQAEAGKHYNIGNRALWMF